MRKKFYLFIIGAILFLLTAICLLYLLLNNRFDFDVFLLNLTTNLISIFITVFIIDRILRIHDNEKWRGVKYKINRSIQKLINSTISSLRNSFGYKLEAICSYEVYKAVQANPKENIHLMEKEMIRISREIIEPNVIKNVEKMDKKSWNSLNINLKGIYDFSESILSLFGTRITPEQFEIIMDLKETLNSIFALYSTFPDIIGVKDEDLPRGGHTPSMDLKRELNETISIDIKKLLQESRNLFNTIN